ncbi:condensation domain-containing protein, partial [Pricia sp.]|uniref:condensation domain-containing protein n=1 Tax=Pricia sp. TaxID=2268138 RepID=UPI0035934A95
MEKASLLGQWKDRKKAQGAPNTIGKAPEGAAIPLSYSQQRLWFLQQLYPRNSFYNYSEKYSFVGDLQVDLLLQALIQVFENHDILRTVYYSEDGQPFMRILPETGISVSQHDLSDYKGDTHAALKKIGDADADHSFDLSEPPVALVSVIRMKKKQHVVMLTLHHIATDKWSMNLLKVEWAEYYRRLSKGSHPEPKVPTVQYPDFAYWQRERKIKQEQLEYWKGKLAGDIPMIDLPTDFPRPREATFIGRSSAFHHFSEQMSGTILRTCKQLGVTPYVFF